MRKNLFSSSVLKGSGAIVLPALEAEVDPKQIEVRSCTVNPRAIHVKS